MKSILLAVTGASPQVVTESLYAISQSDRPMPTVLYLITTSEGREQAYVNLILDGQLNALINDYQLAPIEFSQDNIWVIERNGVEVIDAKSSDDQQVMADFIVSKVYQLTQDDEIAIHASIAGGRKTMAFYLGYALSLFGREQDMLSHVFVSDEFEFVPDFYYPTPTPHLIINPRNRKRLDAAKAKVTLAEIPFVRMRQFLDENLLRSLSDLPFTETVEAINASLKPQQLVIDLPNKSLIIQSKTIVLTPKEIAFYLWLYRCSDGILFDRYFEDEQSHAAQFLTLFTKVSRDKRVFASFGIEPEDFWEGKNTQLKGMEKSFFEQNKANIHSKLNKALPKFLARRLYIQTNKVNGQHHFYLDFPNKNIVLDIIQ